MTFNCLKCGSALASRFVMGGSISECDRCELVYTSVAHLMQRSDTVLVQQFWDYVLSAQFNDGPACPQCHRALSKIPLLHAGRKDPILGCRSCYHLVLKRDTFQHFEKESFETKRNDLALREQQSRMPDSVDRFMNDMAEAADALWFLQIGPQKGKPFIFAFTLGSVFMFGGAAFFLHRATVDFFWSLLAAACTFALGLRYSRGKKPKETREDESDTDESSGARELKDLGSQSSMPATKSAHGMTSYSSSNRRRAG